MLRSWGHTDIGDPNSTSKAEEAKPRIALHRGKATTLPFFYSLILPGDLLEVEE